MKKGDWRINRSPAMLPSGRKALYEKIKKEIFSALGGVCKRCGFSDERALQIDHVNGGGVKEFKKYSGTSYLYRVKKALSAGTYQLLCANCNWIKRHENNEVNKKYADDHKFPTEEPHVWKGGNQYTKVKRIET